MKNLICLLLVAFLATTTFAQKTVSASKADAAVERMTKELDLTADQQVKIKEIYVAKMEARHNKAVQAKEDRVAARDAFDQEIDAVLTPAQAEKRKALKEEHKEKMKVARANRGGKKGGRMGKLGKRSQKLGGMSPEMIEDRADKSVERLHKQVTLTEEQQVSLRAAYLDFFQKNQAIANDTTLETAAKRDALAGLKADHKATIDSLLTPEQLAAKKANKKVKKAKRAEKKQL